MLLVTALIVVDEVLPAGERTIRFAAAALLGYGALVLALPAALLLAALVPWRSFSWALQPVAPCRDTGRMRLTALPTSAPSPHIRTIKLAWFGTRTEDAEPTVAFFGEVLGLRLELERPGFWMLKLPDGGKADVFGPDSPTTAHLTTGPWWGSWSTTSTARPPSCVRQAGGPPRARARRQQNAGCTFAPRDSNLYELTQDPGVSRPP